jgi:hypothetical protein
VSHDTTAYEEDVLAKVKAVCPRTYVTQIPDSVATPEYPYVLLMWIEPIRTGFDHFMVSSLNDTTRGGLIVRIVSSDDDSANKMKNRIKKELTAYRAPDTDEFKLEGGQSFSTSNGNPKPTTYSRELYYSFLTNLSPNN